MLCRSRRSAANAPCDDGGESDDRQAAGTRRTAGADGSLCRNAGPDRGIARGNDAACPDHTENGRRTSGRGCRDRGRFRQYAGLTPQPGRERAGDPSPKKAAKAWSDSKTGRGGIAKRPVWRLTAPMCKGAGMAENGHPVRLEHRDTVAVLVLDSAPVNALGKGLRAAILAALTKAEADPAITAIVIRAEGRSFPVGADISEFGQPPADPALPDLCDRIEACTKPVVAAIHGTALGGGLELALAAHARVALASARVGFPEVTLGILPGAGGTQRLPRLIGAEHALRLMLGGKPVQAAEALALGLLDEVVEDGLEAAALRRAQAMAGQPFLRSSDRTDGLRDGIAFHRAIAAARTKVERGRLPAPARIVDCVEAAQLLPFDMGQAFERAAFDDLVGTPEAQALRHAFFAERGAQRLPVGTVSPPAPRRIGIFGARTADLALPALMAGLEVVLVDPNRPRLVEALERIATAQERQVTEGHMQPAARDAQWARLTPALGAAALEGCELVLLGEAGFLAESVEATMPGTTLALIGRADLAADAARMADILGFRPAGGRLIEVVAGPQTSGSAQARAIALARRLGMEALRCAAPGGIGARVMAKGRAAVAYLIAQGETPAALAGALLDYGLKSLVPDAPEQPAAAVVPRLSGRVLGAMANEGARLLGEGLVARPSDVDFALMAGNGFARWQGGPMFWADRRGPILLRHDLQGWAEERPDLWSPAPLIEDLGARGGHFADLNR
ncbi:UNVERIFIED_CONTAM: ehhadh [Trichonephila clavipes]